MVQLILVVEAEVLVVVLLMRREVQAVKESLLYDTNSNNILTIFYYK
jgi:hypothetical protein